ncbi:hypothetical protein NFI96_021318 [Prochilodus magdalenae]|nr:hypothetical protein NFI96_021318 [Prochilodus magdalenae]
MENGKRKLNEGSDQQDLNQTSNTKRVCTEHMELNYSMLTFPQKLWRIVYSEDYRSVEWHRLGTCVAINVDLFKAEILSLQGEEKIFESSVMKSFMRQMNLYGFKKIRSLESAAQVRNKGPTIPVLERKEVFYNAYFRRGHPELLSQISRRLQIKGFKPRTTAFTTCRQTPQPGLSEERLMDATEVPLDLSSSQDVLVEARSQPDEVHSTTASSLESTLEALQENMTCTTGLHPNPTQLQTTLAAWISLRVPSMPLSVLADLSRLVSRALARPCPRCGHDPLRSEDQDGQIYTHE